MLSKERQAKEDIINGFAEAYREGASAFGEKTYMSANDYFDIIEKEIALGWYGDSTHYGVTPINN